MSDPSEFEMTNIYLPAFRRLQESGKTFQEIADLFGFDVEKVKDLVIDPKLNDSHVDKVRAMISAGLTYKQIMKHFDVSLNKLARFIKAHGLQRRELLKEAIAKLEVDGVVYPEKELPKPVVEEPHAKGSALNKHRALIEELARQGLTFNEIAARLNANRKTVASYCSRTGIEVTRAKTSTRWVLPDSEVATVRQLIERERWRYSEVAERYGCSIATVSDFCQRNRISSRFGLRVKRS